MQIYLDCCCAWWLGEVGSGLEGGIATWLPRGKRGGVSLVEYGGGGTTGVEVGVATTEDVGVAATAGRGCWGIGGADAVEVAGANEPLLLVSLKPRATALWGGKN
jgi:hypothetical protein